MKKIIVITLLLVVNISLISFDLDKNFLIIPMAFYTPETSVALGASFVHFQNPFPETPEITNLNFGIAYFTLKKQFVMNLATERYLKNRDYRADGELVFYRFPDDFYGIGSDTDASLVESYTPIELKFKVELKRRFFREFFAGLGYRMEFVDIQKRVENGLLADPAVLGNDKSFVSAFGFQVDCDQTNDNFFPTRGFYMELSTYFYRSFFGSDYNFEKILFQYSHFYPLLKKHVIGYQFISDNTFGEVPFSAMPKLGGSYMLRGFSEGRFREQKYLAFQTELRLQIYKRFGVVLFGALGEVAETFHDFKMDYLRFGYGLGLRFRLRKVEKLNFRIDFAFSEDDFKFYVAVREVF